MPQQDLPTFESQETPQEAPVPPKKPKPKPTRKRKVRKTQAAPVPKRRPRKARKTLRVDMKNSQFKTLAKEEVFLSPEVYKTIRTLVDLSASERGMVMAIVKGLTDGRAD